MSQRPSLERMIATAAPINNARPWRLSEFDSYLGRILDLLEREGKRATFFCLGQMAKDFPQVVKLIASKGHEVGCHSDKHLWLNKMSREEALVDTRNAVDALEQCLGLKVVSYRAPAFSIGAANQWAFDVLAQCGIERDASVFPAVRDFGGFSQFPTQQPCIIRTGEAQIKEFPIPLANLFGKQLAFSGGGYFRFFPLSFITNQMRQKEYNMTYFHIGDLLPETKKLSSRADYEQYFKEPGTLLNRYKRYIKSNLGTKGASDKLFKLISSNTFLDLTQADTAIDWTKAEVVKL